MTVHTTLRMQLLLALGCDGVLKGDRVETTACMSLDEAGGTCPSADDVDPEDLSPAICGADILRVDGGPTEGSCWYGPSPDTGGHEGCIYDVIVIDHDDCVYGRPYAATAALACREGWATPLRPRVDASTSAARATEWGAIGLAEHASVASFSQLALGLLALGAPATLVRDALHAAAEEAHHARLAFGLAAAYAGHPVGPGPLPIQALPPADLCALAVATVREGCLAETRSALRLAERAETEPDPVVAGVLRRLAADERRHAALAWRTVQWAIGEGGAPVREAVAQALMEGPRDTAWRAVIQPVAAAAGMLAA